VFRREVGIISESMDAGSYQSECWWEIFGFFVFVALNKDET
jgi:hypothetical protein